MIHEEDNTEVYTSDKLCSNLQKQYPDAYIFPSSNSNNFLAANKNGFFVIRNSNIGFEDITSNITYINISGGSK